jgi:hypothetical protein
MSSSFPLSWADHRGLQLEAAMKWSHLRIRGRLRRFSSTGYDVTLTSLRALKESADLFPPLKGAVGGVLVLWDVVEVGGRFLLSAYCSDVSGKLIFYFPASEKIEKESAGATEPGNRCALRFKRCCL